MKKLLYVTMVSALLVACSKDDEKDQAMNVAPTVPTLVFPENTQLCINNALSFKWKAAIDANNDAIVYEIQVAKNKDFSNIVMTALSSASYQNFNLEKATAYYWRVKAVDAKGMSSVYSSVFSFYTAGDGVVNYLPFLPDLVAPDLNSVINATSAQLTWTAKDVDVKDKLVYDVYFGTTNPPSTKISSNLETATLTVPVTGAKEYFWKVIVKDDKGGSTVGQIWRFRTN
jgi:SusE outer membrane protein